MGLNWYMHARPQLFSSHGNPPAPSFSCINFLSSVQQELTCDGQQERASVRLRMQWIRNNNNGDDEGKSRISPQTQAQQRSRRNAVSRKQRKFWKKPARRNETCTISRPMKRLATYPKDIPSFLVTSPETVLNSNWSRTIKLLRFLLNTV